MLKKIVVINTVILAAAIIGLLYFLISGKKSYSPEQQKYITDMVKLRKDKDDFMQNNPESPFRQDSNAVFHTLKYYDVNPDFVFKSRLYRYAVKDTIKIFGTKGEERKAIRYAYVKFNYKDIEYKITVK